jgi:predicted ABC-type ATPase
VAIVSRVMSTQTPTHQRALHLCWAHWPQSFAPTPARLDSTALDLLDWSLGSADTIPQGSSPKLVFITGGVASGKTTLYHHLVATQQLACKCSYALHDPDLIMAKLPGYAQACRNGEISAWSRFEYQAYELSMTALRVAVGARFNVVAMRTLAHETLPDLLEDMVTQRGYELDLHILDVPLQRSLDYAARRADRDGRFISPEIIRERYDKTMERLPRLQALATRVSRWNMVSDLRSTTRSPTALVYRVQSG